MNSLKKVLEKFSKFMDLFGVYVPTLAFAVLFLCFMATMILRYCFKISLNWGSELAVLCYIWIMSFGSGKGLSLGDHVVFSLVYDRCPPKVQMVMKVVYNIVLFVLLLVALPACYKAMMRSNMITGVTTGFSKTLEVNGVGYRVAKQGKDLVMNLGYSHDCEMEIEEGLKVECPNMTEIKVSGANKEQVGQFAAERRNHNTKGCSWH